MRNPYLKIWRKEMGLTDNKLFKRWVRASWMERFRLSELLGEIEIYPGGPKIRRSIWMHETRWKLCKRYSFAIPTKKACRKLMNYGPLVEMGAGNGYWKFCVNQLGGEHVAYDSHPNGNSWQDGHRWSDVRLGEPSILRRYTNHTLFLSWPPMSSMAYESLLYFKGDTVAYIGEGSGGCTADDSFHSLLDEEWSQIEHVAIPQYDGIHDTLNIYRRDRSRKRHWLRYGYSTTT